MIDVLLVVGGLALLTVAADQFVLGAARLAGALHVSPVVIGALVIGFGTSAPELLVSSLATLQGSQDLAFGNIVGSNTANVLLVVGAAAAVRALPVDGTTIRRELVLMLGAVGLLAALTVDGRVSTLDALLLLAAAVAVIGVIVVSGQRDRQAAGRLEAEVSGYTGGAGSRVGRSAARALAGLTGTLLGAQLLVIGATGLARSLGLSEAVIGLTVVAIGTSLPELVTAVAAARRDEPDLIVGNVLGSNIFNSLPVAGVAGLLDSVPLDPAFRLSLVVMVVSCAIFAVFLRTGLRVRRWEGVVLLGLFAFAAALTL